MGRGMQMFMFQAVCIWELGEGLTFLSGMVLTSKKVSQTRDFLTRQVPKQQNLKEQMEKRGWDSPGFDTSRNGGTVEHIDHPAFFHVQFGSNLFQHCPCIEMSKPTKKRETGGR